MVNVAFDSEENTIVYEIDVSIIYSDKHAVGFVNQPLWEIAALRC